MVPKREKVVVAMSGGVDSSVAACLLTEQGYEVIGLFMRTGIEEPSPQNHAGSSLPATPPGRARQGCCSASDAADARYVAGMLGIPFYLLNFEKDFGRLIDYFADEYAEGRTPNPCVVCNHDLKFGRIVEYADAVGAKYIATGHYARIGERGGRKALLRARDTRKDQSYVLFGLERTILDRVLFPIGDLVKTEVRNLASRWGLPNADKPDSVEICFAPDRDYARVVRDRRPDAFAEGDVLNEGGAVIGRHGGIARYTIGQRRGLGIAGARPMYISALDVARNTVTLGPSESLLHGSLIGERVTYVADVPGPSFAAQVKIRYLHTAAGATVHPLPRGRVRVVFDEPQRAVTPGQAAVFYDEDVVLGGAWIREAQRHATSWHSD
jgi:tRNA-specific 2-thiouridylase